MIRFLPVAFVTLSLVLQPVAVDAQNGKKLKRLLENSINKTIRKSTRKTIRKKSRKQSSRRQATGRRNVAKPSVVAPINAENRRIQTALNYFLFDAGTADGIMGKRSKSAVSGYQTFIGLPATGVLSDVGKTILLGSYDHAQNNRIYAAEAIAASPLGVQGLLLAFRDGTLNVPQRPANLAAVAVPVPQTAAPITTTAQQRPVPEAPSSLPAPDPVPVLPTPMLAASDSVALPGETVTGYCQRIDEVSAANDTFVSVESLRDPWLALGEQFCFARDDAVFAGDELMARVQEMSVDDVITQCSGHGPLLKPYVTAAGTQPMGEVLDQVRNFADSTGLPSQQMISTSTICLAIGYDIDDATVAMGSALMLTALGDVRYAELMGHHLSLGVGTERNADLARAWYDPALIALGSGMEPLFDPFNPSRVELIRLASDMAAGQTVVSQ